MFTLIVGLSTPILEKKDDKIKFIKALSVAIIIDFAIFYLLTSYFITN